MDLATYSLLQEGANTLFPQYTNNPGMDYLMKWIPKSEELQRQMLTTSGQVSNTAQVPVQGQYVGTDTRRIGGNNRNIDLANTGIDIATGNIKPDVDEETALRKVCRTSRKLSQF